MTRVTKPLPAPGEFRSSEVPLGPGEVRLVALGGLGEIGMNCLAIEQEGGILVVDCGAGFPDGDLGIDVFHPDFSWLLERADRVAGVFLTHGHEDHIGALPHLLASLEVPIWGPSHALGLASRRLAEHEFGAGDVDLREARAGVTYDVGPFRVEPVRVTHSIVEATALAIETAMGCVVHSGDFNLDPDPPDGEPTDEDRLRSLGDQGVALLLSDSTNVDTPERAGSERAVAATLERLIADAPARVVLAMFASNVQRLISVGEVARRTGRKICLLGRSLDTNVQIATQIGRLRWPSDLLVGAEEARDFPRDRLLVLAGGTQAEQNSALRRLSLGTHQHLALEEGDAVILSSRAIPGNERVVSGMENDLLRLGVTLHNRTTDPSVHTSGHAARKEQERMIELVRPRCFLPVHGTLHHMVRHAELSGLLGVEHGIVIENGTPVRCDGRGFEVEAQIRHGKVPIAFGGEPLTTEVLQARAELGRFGVAVATLVLDRAGALAAPPEVTTRGVPAVDGEASALRALSAELARSVATYREGRGLGFEDFVRRTLRRKLDDLSGTRPTITLNVVRLGA